jgi:tetratricopeptide (TPR) repeat protein
MGLMRCFFTTLLGAILALGCAALALPPQEQELPLPAPEESEPYKPPAAWKSVEIGDYYLRKKDYPGAVSRYQEAVKTAPYYPGGYLGLGKVYEKLGFKEKALHAYRKYLDLLPSAKDALEAKEVQKAVARLEKGKASKGKSSSPTARDR